MTMSGDIQTFNGEATAPRLLLGKEMDSDERLVRETLVDVWTNILVRYSTPGAPIPPPEMLRQELFEVGTNAAVQAVVGAHWFVYDWMVRGKIEPKIREGLNQLDFSDVTAILSEAQTYPPLINLLRAQLRRCILEDV